MSYIISLNSICRVQTDSMFCTLILELVALTLCVSCQQDKYYARVLCIYVIAFRLSILSCLLALHVVTTLDVVDL